MVKKKKKASVKENELYILPSPCEEMRAFVKKFKIDMMEHIISSIDFAIKNKISIVEVFQFKNSPFVVTITEKEFESNLSHISKYYASQNIFELCPRVEQVIKLLKTNEKEKPNTDDGQSGKPDKPK
jgi:hypothetical protein